MAISMDKELGIGSWGPARLSSCVTLLFSKTRILSRCLDLVLEASRRAEQRVRSNNGLNEEESTIEDNSFLQRTLGNHGAARKYIRGPPRCQNTDLVSLVLFVEVSQVISITTTREVRSC